jgi:hypothetical protein
MTYFEAEDITPRSQPYYYNVTSFSFCRIASLALCQSLFQVLVEYRVKSGLHSSGLFFQQVEPNSVLEKLLLPIGIVPILKGC